MKTIEIYNTINYTEPIYDTIFKIKNPVDGIRIEGKIVRPILDNVIFELDHNDSYGVRIGGDGLTQIKGGKFNFDVYGGNGLKIDMFKDWSNITACEFNCFFYHTKKGIDIKTSGNQYINHNNFNFQIRVSEMFADIDKMNGGNIFRLLGQEYQNTNKLKPFFIKDVNSEIDVYISDLDRYEKGVIEGEGIRLGNRMTLQGFKHIDSYANLDNCEIVMNPLLVDTFSYQSVLGDKTFMNTLKIHSNKGKLLVFKGTEYIEL